MITLLDNQFKLFDDATPFISKATCQIYKNEDGGHVSHGTGVF
jgi:hypothetical protein